MDCSFDPQGQFFVFDDAGHTLRSGFRTKAQAMGWMYARTFPSRLAEQIGAPTEQEPPMAKYNAPKAPPPASPKGAMKPGHPVSGPAHASTLSKGAQGRLGKMGC